MRVCVLCKTRYQKGSGITFHKFPSDPHTKQIWLKNMKMFNWSPKCNDHICSKHFSDECFVKHPARTSILYGSVPTILFGNTPSEHKDTVSPTSSVSQVAGVKRKLSGIDVSHKNTYVDEPDMSIPQKKSRTISESSEVSENDHHYENKPCRSISEVCTNISHDHRYVNTPMSTKKLEQHLKKSIKSQARVKLLSQQVRRLKTTVSTLKTILSGFMKKEID